uniref:collagen alpha-1(III) chain-like n=1 Tax=Callithrix jacchus TaxID=9483 RepID=UPI0023DD0851|nr:collagen alpha-1(III) chain-like [Callithrix jacchus]
MVSPCRPQSLGGRAWVSSRAQMFSSIPNLYPLEAYSSTVHPPGFLHEVVTPKMLPDVAKCSLRGKIILYSRTIRSDKIWEWPPLRRSALVRRCSGQTAAPGHLISAEEGAPPGRQAGGGEGHSSRRWAAASIFSRLRLHSTGKGPDRRGPHHRVQLRLASVSRPPEGWLTPLSPAPKWPRPSAGHLVGSRAERVGAPRAGLQGAGLEAWAGGGADVERSSDCRGQGAECSRAGSAPAGRHGGRTREPDAWCSRLSPRYEQGPGVWGFSAGRITQSPRPGLSLCPLPAGRRRDGVSGGFLEVASPSEGSAPLSAFLRLLLAPLALGIGHRREGRFSASRSSPTPGRADEAPGQLSPAAGEAWNSGPPQRRGREAGPGCGLRAWASGAAPGPLHRGAPGHRAPWRAPAPSSVSLWLGAGTGTGTPRSRGLRRTACCARAEAGRPGCGNGPERRVCPASQKVPSRRSRRLSRGTSAPDWGLGAIRVGGAAFRICVSVGACGALAKPPAKGTTRFGSGRTWRCQGM